MSLDTRHYTAFGFFPQFCGKFFPNNGFLGACIEEKENLFNRSFPGHPLSWHQYDLFFIWKKYWFILYIKMSLVGHPIARCVCEPHSRIIWGTVSRLIVALRLKFTASSVIVCGIVTISIVIEGLQTGSVLWSLLLAGEAQTEVVHSTTTVAVGSCTFFSAMCANATFSA